MTTLILGTPVLGSKFVDKTHKEVYIKIYNNEHGCAVMKMQPILQIYKKIALCLKWFYT